MGRVVRFVVVVVLLVACAAVPAAADPVPFERPAFAERELVGERTPESRTWEMPSGRRVTQISTERVQWRDGRGVWREYDLSLREAGRGWSASSGAVEIDLPGRLDRSEAGAVEVRDGAGNALSMTFLGGAGAGSVVDDVAVYRGVSDGVDVRLRAVPEGVKEDVVLRDRGTSRELAYRLTVGSDALSIKADEAGGLLVMRGKEPVFAIPAPSLLDDAGEVGFGGRFEARHEGGRSWLVRAVLPERWLDAPKRAWPVVVDPSVLRWEASASDDCDRATISSGTDLLGPYFTCNVSEWRLVGWVDPTWTSGYQMSQWLLRFNTLTRVQTDAIDSATLRLYRGSNANGPGPIKVHRISSWWSASSPAGSSDVDPVPSAEVPEGPEWQPVEVDLTDLVTQWRRYQHTGGQAGVPNYGVRLSMTPGGGEQEGDPFRDYYTRECGVRAFVCPNTVFASTQHSTAAQRPILEVTSWPAANAGNAVISPGEGELTSKRVPLQARALDSSVRTVRFQYIAGSHRRWTDIPLAALSTPTRGSLASIDVPVSGPTGDRKSDLVIWDVSAMSGGEVDGPVHVRAWLDSGISGEGGMTDEVNFRIDRRGIDKSPTAPIGPGEVNLLSGEFSMSETDATAEAFLQNLTLTRTYRSRGVAVRNADMFGSGWEASVEADGGELPYKGIYNYKEVEEVVVDRQYLDPKAWNWELFFETFEFEALEPEIETFQETERFEVEYAIVEASDGTKMTFTQPSGSGAWRPDDLHPGFRLERAATGTAGIFEFTLTDPSGAVAKFRSEAANSPSYRLSTFKQPGSPRSLSYTYEAAGTRQRLKKVTAPTPTGGHERSLVFWWSNVGDQRVPRVTTVTFEDGTGASLDVAWYGYDAQARLSTAAEPQIAGLARYTYYHYDASGRLDYVAPTGQAAWNLAYTRIANDAGPRLASVSRPHPDGGTATQTIRYDVPLSGSGAPYDMSPTETAKWAQTDDLPWDAVAIWPADTVPDARSPDYSKATIHYVGVHGLTTNVARPGGAIETSKHDVAGNVTRQLSAQGRAAALAAGASSATVAVERSTLYEYTSDDVNLLGTSEPVTKITLSDGRVVTGRRVSWTNYDENAPRGGPFHLPTSEWREVDAPGGPYDVREQVNYQYEGWGGMSGWDARHPTRTAVDPRGKNLVSVSLLHGSYPIVEETRTPGAPGGGTTPDVQWHQYYGIPPTRVPAGIQAAQCRTRATYASGRLCMRSEATTPTASVLRRWYTYSRFGHVATLSDSRTQDLTRLRATTNAYDAADQLTSVEVTGGAGTARPTTTYTYDPATGQQTHARSTAGTITRAFDSNGRLSSYTDSNGSVTTYRYDLRGREASMTIAGSTTSYGYDDRDNRTVVDDPAVGDDVTASYDLDDQLAAESMPNGLVLTQNHDETGRPALLTWTQTSGCSRDCVRARSEIANRDADGRIVGQRSNATQESLSYDTAGRLTRSDAVRLADNRCVRRTYAYDGGGSGDSNRTSSSTWTSRPGDACGSGTPTTRALTYDTADRITSSGWVWDDFGRATGVPAADSGGSGALAASYFTDDLVREMTLDGRTHTYARDPLRRTRFVTSAGAGKPSVTSSWLYSDDTDKPTRISDARNTTRDVEGPSGLVVATNTNGTLSYQLRDIQGSVVATASAAGAVAASTEYDPFGTVTTATPNVIDNRLGLPANGWLGAHQRPTQFGQETIGAAGPLEMGVRVYLPKVGRFLQVDPVDGGSLNAYDYAFQDPANDLDLSGLKSCAQQWREWERDHSTPIELRCNANRPGPVSIKKAFNAVKFVVHVGACAFKLAKSRGVDATACNQF